MVYCSEDLDVNIAFFGEIQKTEVPFNTTYIVPGNVEWDHSLRSRLRGSAVMIVSRT